MLRIFYAKNENGVPYDYVSNSLDRSFPIGLDAGIFSKNTLVRIDEAIKHLSKEERLINENNIIPYLHQNPDYFITHAYKKDGDLSHLRWTLDTQKDFQLIEKIYDALYPAKPNFLMQDILNLLDEYPEWSQINSNVIQLTGYWSKNEKRKIQQRRNKHQHEQGL